MNARSEEFDVNSTQRMSAIEKPRARIDLPSSRTYVARHFEVKSRAQRSATSSSKP